MRDYSHIIWPAAIIGLLLFSGLTVVAVMLASRSDGGAKVVDNYYEKSVAWDSIAATRAAADQLGWIVRARIEVIENAATGILQVHDVDGNPVVGLSGSVTVERPQSNSVFGRQTFEPADDEPGTYRFAFPYQGHGLWDLAIEADRAQQHFSRTVRVEV